MHHRVSDINCVQQDRMTRECATYLAEELQDSQNSLDVYAIFDVFHACFLKTSARSWWRSPNMANAHAVHRLHYAPRRTGRK